MEKIERAERYIPKPDITDLIRQQKELFVDILEMGFGRVSFITLEAALMMPGDYKDILFYEGVRLEIRCESPRSPQFNLDPQWKQYYINDEWVGNIHGMQKMVVYLCWQGFYERLEELLAI